MTETTLRIRLVRIFPLLLICAVWSGCVVPMRAPTKIQTPEGKGLKKSVELGFLQPGKTTRKEVDSNLSWVATDVKDDRFFIGRWAESKWGIAVAMPGGGAGWDRHWKEHNLVIDFDQGGIVQQFSQPPNDKLFQVLRDRIRKEAGHPLDLSVPIEIRAIWVSPTGEDTPGKLVLGRDFFAFVYDKNPLPEFVQKKRHMTEYKHQTTPGNIRSLGTVNSSDVDSSNPLLWIVRIQFKRPIGLFMGRMDVRIDLPATLTLIRYYEQVKSGVQGGPS